MSLSGLEIFKYLPAAKKSIHSNCKECGFKSCMDFAINLSKNYNLFELCPYLKNELLTTITKTQTYAQSEVEIGLSKKIKIGGENVMFRHNKKFINPTAFFIALDTDNATFEKELERILNFEILKLSKTYKIDGVFLKGSNINSDLRLKIENKGISTLTEDELEKYNIIEIEDERDDFSDTMENLICIRRAAILENTEKYLNPVYVYLKKQDNLVDLSARAAFYICKYANMLIFENFDEALISTLITLRQNIFSDPQAPLQVESKIYEFNEPDEKSPIFMTTNFSLTYHTMANELAELDIPSYLVLIPTGGMSVLAAWAAEKITTQIISETIDKLNLRDKVRTREIIIPGVLAPIKDDIQKEIPDFKIIVGAVEAYKTKDFVKNYKIENFAE